MHDSPTKWFVEFKKEVRARSSEDESLDGVGTFSELPVKLKTQLLHSLCEWQTDNVELFRSSIVKEEQEETDWVCSSLENHLLLWTMAKWLFLFDNMFPSLGEKKKRVEPVGYDANWNSYWLFDGLLLSFSSCSRCFADIDFLCCADFRMYRESPPLPQGKGKTTAPTIEWELVCRTSEDWKALPAQFENSKNPGEQTFYKLLIEDILPSILPDLQATEKSRAKRDKNKDFPMKRSSRILALVEYSCGLFLS